MKKLLILFAMTTMCLLFANKSQAQVDWTPLDTISNVLVSYQLDTVPCYGDVAVFMRFENTNVNSVTVSWTLWNNVPTKEAVLNGQDEISGNCFDVNPPYPLIERIPIGETINSMTPIINIVP